MTKGQDISTGKTVVRLTVAEARGLILQRFASGTFPKSRRAGIEVLKRVSAAGGKELPMSIGG